MDSKLDVIIDNIKVLKVLGTKEANERKNQIIQYFDKIESIFDPEAEILDEKNLNGRVKKMMAVRRKKISHLLATIDRTDDVSQLNPAQQADYLRRGQPNSQYA